MAMEVAQTAQSAQPQAVKRKERINELDVLRGLAFLAVVFQHTLGVYIRNDDIQLNTATMLGMLFNIVKFAVPAFVFLTGITLYYNYYEKLNYGKFMQKRTREILVPYILWAVIYELYLDKGLPPLTGNWLVGFVKNLVVGREFYHLWFVPMIFQFYLFFPIFRWLARVMKQTLTNRFLKGLALLLFTAAYAWFMQFTVSYIGGGHLHPTSWLGKSLLRFLDRNFLWWSSYFVLGAIVGLALYRWRAFVVRSVQWNSFLFVLLFVWVGYELMHSANVSGHVDLNYSTSLKPSMFFYTVSEILLLYGLSLVIAGAKGWLYKWFDWFGKYSYGAYLAHALVLNYSIRFVAHFVHSEHYLFKTFLCWAICAGVTTLLIYLLSKIPYASLLVGTIRKKAVPKPNVS